MSLRIPWLLDRVLTLGAVLGGLCLAWAGATFALGLTPLVVLSGSMSPAIDTGALAVARTVPAAEVRVGEVVSVVADSGVRVTHRVVAADPLGDGAVELVLRGDANVVPDPQTYRVAEVEQVWFHVPHLGRVVAAASGRGGTLVALGLVLAALGAALYPRGRKRTQDAGVPRHRREVAVARQATAGALVVALLGTGALMERAVPTAAAFTDDSAVMGATSTAAALPVPIVDCIDNGSILRFQWPAHTDPLVVEYTATLSSGRELTPIPSGANWYVEVSGGLLSSLLGTRQTLNVRSRDPALEVWRSDPGRRDFVVTLLGLTTECLGGPY